MKYIAFEADGLKFYEYDDNMVIATRPDPDTILRKLRYLCIIAEGVTLGQIFAAVNQYDLLILFVHQYSWCGGIKQFHAQAKLPAAPCWATGIEYLEVYHTAESEYGDKRSVTYEVSDGFHGVGTEDGRRVQYGVSMTPMNQIAHLPVRLKRRVQSLHAA